MNSKRTRSRRLIVAAVVSVLALALAAAAQARRPTHITIKHWLITGSTSGDHFVTPGSTFTHCASELATHLDVQGRVRRAIEDKHFKVRFLLNGVQRDVFPEHWTSSGGGRFFDGIVNNSGLPDGFWVFKATQAGRTIGRSSVTLATNPAC